LEDGIGDTVS